MNFKDEGVSGQLFNWRHHPLQYVSREEETMDLRNLPEYISAILAIIALPFLVTKLVSAINSLYLIDV